MKVVTIGRNAENDVVVNDKNVSRVHLQILQNDNGGFSVIDLNSANGTFVNGQRIQKEAALQRGDVVQIGNTHLQWEKCFVESAKVEQPAAVPAKTPKSNRKWWYITATTLVLLLIAACILMLNIKRETKKYEKSIEMNDTFFNNK